MPNNNRKPLAIRRGFYHGGRADASIRLYFLTDLHIGTAACDEDLLRRDIQRIKDEGAYWIGGGDYVEGIAPRDPRWDSGVMADWIENPESAMQEQCERVAKLLAPIAPQCLALLKGNHEHAPFKHSGFDPYRFIVREVARARDETLKDCELALGFGGYISLRSQFGPETSGTIRTFNMWVHHGAGSAGVGLPGNYALKLGRYLDRHPVPLILTGHLHVKDVVVKETPVIRTKWVESIERKAFIVPSYMRGNVAKKTDKAIPPQTYSEERAMPDTPVGTFPIDIYWNIGEAKAWM